MRRRSDLAESSCTFMAGCWPSGCVPAAALQRGGRCTRREGGGGREAL